MEARNVAKAFFVFGEMVSKVGGGGCDGIAREDGRVSRGSEEGAGDEVLVLVLASD